MSSLKKSIVKKGYRSIPFKITKTSHLVIKGKLNGVKASFILDTGASNSCIGLDQVAAYKIETTDSEVKAAGAGAVGMDTQHSSGNTLQLNKWKTDQCNLVVFDMSHVNQALEAHDAKPINGILGADILIKYKAVIDYKSKTLFLKKK